MASQNIAFDTIPSGIRKPGKYFEYNTKLAVRTLPANDQTVIIVGQRTADGTVPALKPVDVFSGDQAALYFGAGSLAHIAAVAAITANKYVSLTVIAVDDAQAGQPAKGSVEFKGPATADGAFALIIGNTRVDIAVYATDTETAIATRLAAQIAQKTALPVTADSVNGKVTLTTKNKGAFGNDMVLSQLNQAAGVTATITAFTGGLNDPDIALALAAVYGAKYNVYVTCWPTKESLTKLRTHLDSISGPLEQRPAVSVAGTPATLATATTLAGDLDAGRITIGWHPGSVCLPAEIAAAYAAVIASETDPARPLNTLALTGLDVTPIPSQPGRTEQEKALHNGVTPFEIGPGNAVQIVRSITTYTKDAQGIDDPALLDITTIRTLDYVRKACQQRIALRFPREKQSEKTPPKVRSELLDVLYKLEELEIIENVDANKDKLIVERDLQDVNQLNAAIPCDVVNGLHVFAGRIDLIL
ncbi:MULTISPECIES: phage tail sheath C-terminal domain-containing protein [Burkholderia]|uniref:phage tail sheath C-terminal domain-containing protein n=1 Tax=Burkholderia TaxID=32008 RepID=UPI00075A70DD|nr:MULTISPECIES: phage tail sheath C-terminal domain-containing protein [Burkholderia]AOJ67507.1 phage tail protein [Burkholderia savannae]KVG39868.1 phage tail protein [Burkholderia sp. MSMB0265]KVG86052.1 phage tail protein [Burkholderia sp. MSMB2040]KVG98781.1 phage tail protein [Burkholderia sp. MSMB2042]KVH00731.1 phage tail protein [Burkholderia sp. MSMB2041]